MSSDGRGSLARRPRPWVSLQLEVEYASSARWCLGKVIEFGEKKPSGDALGTGQSDRRVSRVVARLAPGPSPSATKQT